MRRGSRGGSFRQGGHLTQDDFQKVVDRRRLAADEVLETYRRLRDNHAIAVERSGSPERRQPRRPSASDPLSMLLAGLVSTPSYRGGRSATTRAGIPGR